MPTQSANARSAAATPPLERATLDDRAVEELRRALDATRAALERSVTDREFEVRSAANAAAEEVAQLQATVDSLSYNFV